MRSRYLDLCPEAPRGSEERDEQEWLWLQPEDPILAGEEIEPFTAHDLIVVRMQRAMMISGPQFLGIQECNHPLLARAESARVGSRVAAHHATLTFFCRTATLGQ